MRKVVLIILAGVLAVASSGWAVLGGGDITFKVEGMNSVLYSHDIHVGKMKLGCKECHYGLYTNHAQHKAVGMAAMRQGKSCGFCHNGTRAFSVKESKNCSRCHSIPPK